MPRKKDWTLWQLWKLWTHSRRRLEEVRGQPYFGRIDFRETGHQQPAAHYIGKVGAPGVVDWRAPVATLFYENTAGMTRYAAPKGTVHGYLSLRRQYRIQAGELLDLFDSLIEDSVRRSVLAGPTDKWADLFLYRELERSAGERLKDIIATIQAEQNRVIRSPFDTVTVVQGVAGSGKTTVALHRVAYLLYTYPVQVKPERVLVLAPNRLFLQYIEELLPDTLGVSGVIQDTLGGWTAKIAGAKPAPQTLPPEALVYAGDRPDSPLQAFLRSPDATGVLDAWLEEFIEKHVLPDGDVRLGESFVISNGDMRRWFFGDYACWPVATRISRLKRKLERECERYLERTKAMAQDESDRYLRSVARRVEREERQKWLGARAFLGREWHTPEVVSEEKVLAALAESRGSMLASRAEMVRKADAEANAAVDEYVGAMPQKDLHFLAWEAFLASAYGARALGHTGGHGMLRDTAERAKRRRAANDELPALCYVRDYLYGVPEKERYDHIVVDEAQDLTPLLCAVLAGRCSRSSLTLVGDLAQAIFARGDLYTWDQVLGRAFPRARIAEFNFAKSYRSTCEIIGLGRRVLEKSGEPLELPEPVLRHGPEPVLKGFSTDPEMVDAVVQAVYDVGDRHRSLAVVTPDGARAREVHAALRKSGIDLCLIESTDAVRTSAGVVLPVEAVRGLEFDAVIVAGADDRNYPRDSTCLRRLYVALTRALHELHVFWVGRPSPLLPCPGVTLQASDRAHP
jgi:DNA helicase-2/ATP-dependent DNA helicase PcrA